MARLRNQTPADALVYTYRWPGRRFAPRAWLWSGTGGLALGLTAAIGLAVTGQIEATDSAFRTALASGSLVGAVAFYFFYRLTLYRMVLRITFDAAQQTVGVRLMNAKETRWYSFEDVLVFRLVRHAEGWRRGCGLVMDTDSAGPVELVLTDLPCYERTGLPQLVRRLSTQLDILHGDTSEYPVPPQPGVMSRAQLEASEPSGQRRLPDVHP